MNTPECAVHEMSANDITSFYEGLKAKTLAESSIHARPYLGQKTPEYQKGVIVDGFFFRGRFSITLKDATTGIVNWHHEQDNLMTDVARYQFWNGEYTNMRLGFVPSVETPMIARSSISTDVAQCFLSDNLGNGTVNPTTYTRTYSANFNTPPASNRRLGSVIWMYWNYGLNNFMGPEWVSAYALLTPPKIQTTLQTVEVVYKISMTPIY